MDALLEGFLSDLPAEYQPGIVQRGRKFEAQYGNPTAYPLGPPTVSTTSITVDMALNQPTRITRTLMDLTLHRFFAHRVFPISREVQRKKGNLTEASDEAVRHETMRQASVEARFPS